MTESSMQLPQAHGRLRPLGNRLLVKLHTAEKKSAGGIVLPETLPKEIVRGLVLEVGPGEWKDGIFVEPAGVKKGDTIIFSKCMSYRVSMIGHEEVLAIPSTDVMCVEA